MRTTLVSARDARVFAVDLARDAAALVRRLNRPHRALRLKTSSTDVVTATDLAVERYIRGRIGAAFPHHQIVGEEGSGLGHVWDPDLPTWFVDPLDGTTNYLRGLPFVACNIAFSANDQVLAGATADVTHRRIYWAERGGGAWMGRHRLSVSSHRTLAATVLSTGFPHYRASSDDNNLAEFSRLVLATRDIKRIGCAGLDLAWVAKGQTDGYWEQGDGPWDWAVGSLLVSEAGGAVTDYNGDRWRPGVPTLVASNGLIHDEMIRLITTSRALIPATT